MDKGDLKEKHIEGNSNLGGDESYNKEKGKGKQSIVMTL